MWCYGFFKNVDYQYTGTNKNNSDECVIKVVLSDLKGGGTPS